MNAEPAGFERADPAGTNMTFTDSMGTAIFFILSLDLTTVGTTAGVAAGAEVDVVEGSALCLSMKSTRFSVMALRRR